MVDVPFLEYQDLRGIVMRRQKRTAGMMLAGQRYAPWEGATMVKEP